MTKKIDPGFDVIRSLRDQITLNSLFVCDYANSFGFDEEEVCCLFDGYMDYLGELVQEQLDETGETVSDDEWYDRVFAMDSDDALHTWWWAWLDANDGFTIEIDDNDEEEIEYV